MEFPPIELQQRLRAVLDTQASIAKGFIVRAAFWRNKGAGVETARSELVAGHAMAAFEPPKTTRPRLEYGNLQLLEWWIDVDEMAAWITDNTATSEPVDPTKRVKAFFFRHDELRPHLGGWSGWGFKIMK